MNKTRSITMALVIICSTIAFISCDKKDDPAPTTPEKTKTELLTQASWKLFASGFDSNKDGVIDVATPGLKPCTLDNTYTFDKSGTGVLDEAATKCDPAAPQSSPFSWIFKEAETIINGNIPMAGWSGDGTITALNDTSFIFYKDTVIFSIPGRAIISLKH